MKKIITLLAIIAACSSCANLNSKNSDTTLDRESYSNILNIHGNPKEYTYFKPIKETDKSGTNYINSFIDLGAWHGYYQPDVKEYKLYGGFAGPFYIAEEYAVNLSDSFNKISIENAVTKERYDLAKSEATFNYYPGKLEQKYVLKDFTLKLELIFVSNRSALIKSEIINISGKELSLNLNWTGNMYNEYQNWSDSENRYKSTKLNNSLEKTGTGVKVNFENRRDTWDYLIKDGAEFKITHSSNVDTKIVGDSYTSQLDTISILPNKNFTHYMTETFTFTEVEAEEENKNIKEALKDPEKAFASNEKRWNGYLNRAIDKSGERYNKIAVKAI
ncbi:hypothetical protein I6E31_10090, partial [Fusobacterium varium]|nr:hypothetical protein [Fusobacterium varium]